MRLTTRGRWLEVTDNEKAEDLVLSVIQKRGVASMASLTRLARNRGIDAKYIRQAVADFLKRRSIELTADKKYRFARG